MTVSHNPTYHTTSITTLQHRKPDILTHNKDHQNTMIMSETSVGAPIQLPILDISNPDDVATGKAMLDAAARYGFLYVDSQGSDFSAKDVKRAFGLVSLTLYHWPLHIVAVLKGTVSSSFPAFDISD